MTHPLLLFTEKCWTEIQAWDSLQEPASDVHQETETADCGRHGEKGHGSVRTLQTWILWSVLITAARTAREEISLDLSTVLRVVEERDVVEERETVFHFLFVWLISIWVLFYKMSYVKYCPCLEYHCHVFTPKLLNLWFWLFWCLDLVPVSL